MSLYTTAVIFVTYFLKSIPDNELSSMMSNYSMAFFSAFSFLLGAAFSGLSGYAGIWVSVRANLRVASAARTCYHTALSIAFQGGYFAAVVNVALAIFG